MDEEKWQGDGSAPVHRERIYVANSKSGPRMSRTLPQTLAEKIIIKHMYGMVPHAMYDIGVGQKSEATTLHKRFKKMQVFGCEPHPKLYRQLEKDFPGDLRNVAHRS